MSYDRFFMMLDQVPRIRHLWDASARTLDTELFEQEMGVLSTSEAHMARFFAAVWFGDNRRYGFDLVKAAASLGPELRQIIMDWCADPFWP